MTANLRGLQAGGGTCFLSHEFCCFFRNTIRRVAETSPALFPKWGKKKVFVLKQMKINTNHKTKIMNAKQYIKMWLACSICMHFNMHLSFPLLRSAGIENIKQLSAINN